MLVPISPSWSPKHLVAKPMDQAKERLAATSLVTYAGFAVRSGREQDEIATPFEPIGAVFNHQIRDWKRKGSKKHSMLPFDLKYLGRVKSTLFRMHFQSRNSRLSTLQVGENGY